MFPSIDDQIVLAEQMNRRRAWGFAPAHFDAAREEATRMSAPSDGDIGPVLEILLPGADGRFDLHRTIDELWEFVTERVAFAECARHRTENTRQFQLPEGSAPLMAGIRPRRLRFTRNVHKVDLWSDDCKPAEVLAPFRDMPHVVLLGAAAFCPEWLWTWKDFGQVVNMPGLTMRRPDHELKMKISVAVTKGLDDGNLEVARAPDVIYPAAYMYQTTRLFYNEWASRLFFQSESFLKEGKLIPIYA